MYERKLSVVRVIIDKIRHCRTTLNSGGDLALTDTSLYAIYRKNVFNNNTLKYTALKKNGDHLLGTFLILSVRGRKTNYAICYLCCECNANVYISCNDKEKEKTM